MKHRHRTLKGLAVLILFACAANTAFTAVRPRVETAPDGAIKAIELASFEGIEEPEIVYAVKTKKFKEDMLQNITDVGDHTVRMFLRYKPDTWDGDRDLDTTADRQRAEVKGLGPHQKIGDTFEYDTTFRTDPQFKGSGRFCHIFQLKATEGDKGAPLVTLSILEGNHNGALQYWSGDAHNSVVARKFEWKPGEWQKVRIRIKTSFQKDGEVMASINGDEFSGAKDVAIFRPEAEDYRPKWGLYRGVGPDMKIGDDWIEHKDVSAKKE